MAEDVLILLTCILALAVGDDRVHAVFCVFALLNQVRPHGRGDDVGYKGPPFREVGREVHLLPPVLLLEQLHAGEAEVLTNSPPFDEVYHTV